MLTQFTLKLLALVFMLLDHTGQGAAADGYAGATGGNGTGNADPQRYADPWPGGISYVCVVCRRGLPPKLPSGEILPASTDLRDLSEVPFQLCFYGAADFGFQLGGHNVLFTILLSAAAIYISSVLERRGFNSAAVQILTSGVAIALGWVLRTDYNAWGVALILGLYYVPRRLGQLGFAAAWVTVFQLLWHGWDGTRLVWFTATGSIQLLYWLGGLFGVLLLAAYSGERGPKSKWLFYCFYPAHLALLFLLTRI